MQEIRRSEERGFADHGWLKSFHTFSFGEYYDPAFMGFRSLRVINEDRVTAGAGFPTHPHRDMEIITLILEGAIAHKDSMGNEGRTGAGDVQVMSAGSGVRHAEYNLENETTTLFQIWIMPRTNGGDPILSRPETRPRSARRAREAMGPSNPTHHQRSRWRDPRHPSSCRRLPLLRGSKAGGFTALARLPHEEDSKVP